MSRVSVWEWVKGRSVPKLTWRLKAVADYFEVSMDELLFGEANVSGKENGTSKNTSDFVENNIGK